MLWPLAITGPLAVNGPILILFVLEVKILSHPQAADRLCQSVLPTSTGGTPCLLGGLKASLTHNPKQAWNLELRGSTLGSLLSSRQENTW